MGLIEQRARKSLLWKLRTLWVEANEIEGCIPVISMMIELFCIMLMRLSCSNDFHILVVVQTFTNLVRQYEQLNITGTYCLTTLTIGAHETYLKTQSSMTPGSPIEEVRDSEQHGWYLSPTFGINETDMMHVG